MQTTNTTSHPSSFRDPSGRIVMRDGIIYREINKIYQDHYDLLMESGLYNTLTDRQLLVHHKEIQATNSNSLVYKEILPDQIPLISYPYEWSFSQLKSAALLTLDIQQLAIEHGLVLKDASAYNVQFLNGKPIFIDTLSFEKAVEGRPWFAYKQFCQHFLAPLALMAKTDIRLQQMMRLFIDGIPLDLASTLLPLSSRMKMGISIHIVLHSKYIKEYDGQPGNMKAKEKKVSTTSQKGLVDSLRSTINSLTWEPKGTEWADYYSDTNYTDKANNHKKEIVAGYLKRTNPTTVWDFGANNGEFSRLASDMVIQTVAWDIDPAAIEMAYRWVVKSGETKLLPLLVDLTNPSPGIGWANEERSTVQQRGPADMVMALAVIHHLAIGNNVGFDQVAEYFASCGKKLIIEFVPKNDSQIARLLVTRDDIFQDYNREQFETAFRRWFTIMDCVQVVDSGRLMYLMEKRVS